MGHSHSSNSPQRDLIPYLYTGKYQTSLTGLIDMDARWYNPQVGRFIQPDYYNFAQLALPNGARNKLLATTSLNTQMLLNDPSQQMRYGYVSGNPMRWVDPMGLVQFKGSAIGEPIKTESIGLDTYGQKGAPVQNAGGTAPRTSLEKFGNFLVGQGTSRLTSGLFSVKLASGAMKTTPIGIVILSIKESTLSECQTLDCLPAFSSEEPRLTLNPALDIIPSPSIFNICTDISCLIETDSCGNG